MVDTRFFSHFTGGQEYIIYRKRGWPESWGVCLQWWAMKDFEIGFTCPAAEVQDEEGRRASKDEYALIKAAVEDKVRAIDDKVKRHAEWWPAYTSLKEPFRDWTEAQTLVLLAGHDVCDDGQSAVATFVGWFLNIADAAASTIDEILQSSTHSADVP